MKQVQVFCSEEKKVVGHIEIHEGPIETVLTWPILLRSFVPVDNKYQLSGSFPIGKPLRCPKCLHNLVLSGELQTSDKRPTKTGRMAASSDEVFDVEGKIIIIGKTKVRIDGD
jgi:hypothetical protein